MANTYYIETELNPWELAQGRRELVWQVYCDDGSFAPEFRGEYYSEEDALERLRQLESEV